MSNIVLNTITYVGRGLQNGVARYITSAAGTLARFVRRLTGQVVMGPNVTTVRWALTIPVAPGEDDPACPCPGEQPMRDTQIEVIVRSDARAPSDHRATCLASVQDLVQDASFGVSVTDLVQPAG